jgi:hypothetical protein
MVKDKTERNGGPRRPVRRFRSRAGGGWALPCVGVVCLAALIVGFGSLSADQKSTPASTRAYLGPSCSKMKPLDTAGYSMCDPIGAPCPRGWHSVSAPAGACEPDRNPLAKADAAVAAALGKKK